MNGTRPASDGSHSILGTLVRWMQAYPTMLGRRMGAPARVSRAAPGSHSLFPQRCLARREKRLALRPRFLLRGAHPAVR